MTQPELSDRKECIFEGCRRKTRSKYGLCDFHYRQQFHRIKGGTISKMDEHLYPFKVRSVEHAPRIVSFLARY